MGCRRGQAPLIPTQERGSDTAEPRASTGKGGAAEDSCPCPGRWQGARGLLGVSWHSRAVGRCGEAWALEASKGRAIRGMRGGFSQASGGPSNDLVAPVPAGSSHSAGATWHPGRTQPRLRVSWLPLTSGQRLPCDFPGPLTRDSAWCPLG